MSVLNTKVELNIRITKVLNKRENSINLAFNYDKNAVDPVNKNPADPPIRNKTKC